MSGIYQAYTITINFLEFPDVTVTVTVHSTSLAASAAATVTHWRDYAFSRRQRTPRGFVETNQ